MINEDGVEIEYGMVVYEPWKGGYYLKKDADAKIAKLEKELNELREATRLRKVSEGNLPFAVEGEFVVLWEDGLLDIGYVDYFDGELKTIRGRSLDVNTGDEGHSIEWWFPKPKAPEVK